MSGRDCADHGDIVDVSDQLRVLIERRAMLEEQRRVGDTREADDAAALLEVVDIRHQELLRELEALRGWHERTP